MYRLNVIGCGKVGRTLTRLFVEKGLVSRLCLVSRSLDSAKSARDFIGLGDPKNSIAELPAADVWMIAAGDARLSAIARELADVGAQSSRNLIFHCSGAVDSSVLLPLRARSVLLGSVHPIRSFADPELAHRLFCGTSCALEGEPEAIELLHALFSAIGAETFELSAESKSRCHAGHVIVSNYLVALLDVGRRVYESAGVPDDSIDSFMSSLAQGTVENVKALGIAGALTGPIVRGEIATVSQQLESLRQEPKLSDAASVYSLMGQVATRIAERKGALSCEDVKRLTELLQGR